MYPQDDHDTTGVPDQFEEISRVVLAAHEAQLRDAADDELWKRRGLLQRLVRSPT